MGDQKLLLPHHTIQMDTRLPMERMATHTRHYQPYIAWKRTTIKIPIIIWKYQKPKKKTYYTYVKVPDWNDYNNHVTSTKEYFRGFPTPVPDSIEAGDSFKGTLRKNLPGFVIGYELDIGIWMIENHPEDCTLIFFDPTFAWSK